MAARRRELRIQSEVNRWLMAARCDEFRAAAVWLETGFEVYQMARPAVKFLGPLFRLVAERLFPPPGESAGKVGRAWRIFKAVQSFWKNA